MKTIGVPISFVSPGRQRLFDALEEVFDVQFERRDVRDGLGIDAWVFSDADQEFCRLIERIDRPCYVVVRQGLLVPRGRSTKVDFTGDPSLPSELRSRQVIAEEASELRVLPPWYEDWTVLAAKSGNPLWSSRQYNLHVHHYTVLPIPELNEGEPLFQYFQGRRFLRLLPFLLFLRNLTEDRDWQPPPRQACFMFDDPNLHWPTYGYLDFNEIGLHAREHGYHVSFATIPRDAWLVHSPTADFFRQHRDRLSLLIHGNDHIRDELARPFPPRDRGRFLGEALGRVAKLEERAGVEVSKIMAPPHGACSEEVLEEMARRGFEAACVSRGSLHFHNPQANWLRALGMRPADQIKGLTVIPRFPFSGDCQNSILVAAVLGQPIIPMGHHTGVAEGLGIFEKLSDFVHSLGSVRWADMQSISRWHYARKIDGQNLHLRMYTRRATVHVVEGINRLCLESLWPAEGGSRILGWRIVNKNPRWRLQPLDDPIQVLPGQEVEIVTDPRILNPVSQNPRKIPHVWPALRRTLSEAKDRLVPVWQRIYAGKAV